MLWLNLLQYNMPSIAIIGASNNHEKFGNKAVRAYLQKGYTVYPINPKEEVIEGLKAYKSVLEVPGPIEQASFYILPQVGLKVIEEIAKKGIKEVYLNPGTESNELYEKAQKLGVTPIVACSIVAVGISPSQL